MTLVNRIMYKNYDDKLCDLATEEWNIACTSIGEILVFICIQK